MTMNATPILKHRALVNWLDALNPGRATTFADEIITRH